MPGFTGGELYFKGLKDSDVQKMPGSMSGMILRRTWMANNLSNIYNIRISKTREHV